MENILHFKYEIILLFVSVFFSYFSYKRAMFKYNYRVSLAYVLIPNVCMNIFVILIGWLSGLDFLYFSFLLIFLNLAGPYLAIRKVSNYSKYS